jgi:WD40 repeat protein
MPWTFAHPAAVLPLRKFCADRLSFAGLVVGSVSPDIGSASIDRTLQVWDLDSGRELRTFEGHKRGVSWIALTVDGKRAVSAGGDHTMVVWDLENGTLVTSFESDSAVLVGAVTPDGLNLIAGDSQGCVYILRLENSVRQREFLPAMRIL